MFKVGKSCRVSDERTWVGSSVYPVCVYVRVNTDGCAVVGCSIVAYVCVRVYTCPRVNVLRRVPLKGVYVD